jgi:hypothetical protein
VTASALVLIEFKDLAWHSPLPHRHQPVSANLKFGRAFLNGGGLVRGLDIAQPNGLRSELIDAPPDRLRLFGLLGHARSIGRELCRFNQVDETPALQRGEMCRSCPGAGVAGRCVTLCQVGTRRRADISVR